MTRRVRPVLERDKPIRSVTHHLLCPVFARAGDDEMADGAGGPRSVNKIISDAVCLGYNVIDEQIRQGREAAERFRGGAYSNSHAEEDVKKLMDRMLFLVKELGVVGFDMAGAVVRDLRSSSGGRSPADLTIQVQSKRRVELNYHLIPAVAAHFEPAIAPLYAADRQVAPLENIRIEAKAHRPVLVVEVPDDQPPGTYTAVILDAASKQPSGFISVTVLN
jgi:hypothetical protein